MRLQILGCSGGIASRLWTTALLLDDDVLIDAGTGVNDLSLDEMAKLRHVVLTHSHLDHVACLPLLLDSVFDRLPEPVTVHGLPETLRALRQHIFNDPARPVLRYAELSPGETLVLGKRTLTPILVNHSVPAVAYRIDGEHGSVVFSGDTTTNDGLWNTLNSQPPFDMLIVEAAFSDADRELSIASRHYCPELLAADLFKLAHRPKIYLTHPKPGDEDIIFTECRAHLSGYDLHRLCAGDSFTL